MGRETRFGVLGASSGRGAGQARGPAPTPGGGAPDGGGRVPGRLGGIRLAFHPPRLRRFALFAFALLVPLAALPVAARGRGDAGEAWAPVRGDQTTATATATPDMAPRFSGHFQHPVSLDVASDGRVFVSDPGPGGVHVLWPWGAFEGPIGRSGPEDSILEAAGRLAIGRDPASGRERLYVLDTGARDLKIYELDGSFVAVWPKIRGVGIAVARDGRIFVADRTLYQVRVFAPDGSPLFEFGERGTEPGQFDNLSDLGLSPDGRTVAVGDLKGKRLQVFSLPADPTSGDVGQPTVHDLTHSRYTSGELTCLATTVNVLGPRDLWIGEGNGACRIVDDRVSFPIASAAFEGTICKPAVRIPRIRQTDATFYALATYDPNLGPCGGKQAVKPAAPVVVRYMDLELRRVHTVWPAGSAYFAVPSDDAQVRSSTPDANYGGDSNLRLRNRADEVINSYLKFEVENLDQVVGKRGSTHLQLYVSNSSDHGGALYAVSNNHPTTTPNTTPNTTPTPWDEDSLTWNNAPPITGTPLAPELGEVAEDTWVRWTLSGTVVPGEGVYSFGLRNSSSNAVDYRSRNADTDWPVLVLEMVVASVPTPGVPSPSPTPSLQPSATFTPSATPTPSQTPTFTPTPTFAPGSALVFSAAHDARVQSTAPDRSFGDSTHLRVRTGLTSTVYHSFLKFEVAGMGARRPVSATLRVYSYDGGNVISAYPTGNDFLDTASPWTEDALTWNNAPLLGETPLATLDKVANEVWAEFDVLAAMRGDGTYSFALRTATESSAYFHSKEAPLRQPELLLRFTGPAPPEPSPTPSDGTPATPGSPSPSATAPGSPSPRTPTPSATLRPGGPVYLPSLLQRRADRRPLRALIWGAAQ